jgi:hypothetical protein
MEIITSPEAGMLECNVGPLLKSAPLGRVKQGNLMLLAQAVYAEDLTNHLMVFLRDMDYANHREVQVGMLYILLGYTAKRCAVGLVLLPIEDGQWKRVGKFRAWDSRAPEKVDSVHVYPFSEPFCKQLPINIG